MIKQIKSYVVYIVLAVVGLILRFVPVSSGILIVDSVINEIAVGIIASAITAGLIEFSIERRRYNRNKRLTLRLLYPTCNSITEYMEYLCRLCSIGNNHLKNKDKDFCEWVKCYSQLTFADAELINHREGIVMRSDAIKKCIDDILSNQLFYIKEDIASEEFISELEKIGKELPYIFVLDNSKIDKYYTHNLEEANLKFADAISNSNIFNVLMKTKYCLDHPNLKAIGNAIKEYTNIG